MRLPAGYERYFQPTMVTEQDGRLCADIAGDIPAPRPEPLRAAS
jgi:hypothetical protein